MPQPQTPPLPGAVVDGFDDPLPDTIGQELIALGWEINRNQHCLVHLAAEFADAWDWGMTGAASAAHWIARKLDIEPSTAREWIRIGRALKYLSAIDRAFKNSEISYTKVRSLTRWADEDTEEKMLGIAKERPACRLNAALAKEFAADEDDDDRDKRHHDARSFSHYTDPDGMVIGTFRLPPLVAKQIIAAIEAIMRLIARTPTPDANAEPDAAGDADAGVASGEPSSTASATSADTAPSASPDASPTPSVTATRSSTAESEQDPPADAPAPAPNDSDHSDFVSRLAELHRRWPDDDWCIPSLAQQRADALVMLFTGLTVELKTEIVLHVRGDGNTFDDGTPLTNNAIIDMLPDSMVRAMIHDAERRPINASSKQRYPTQRQYRVVMETYNHECVDCGSTDLIEIDHNPAYEQTRRTITEELEPRCAPCHRARHRHEDTHHGQSGQQRFAA